VQGSRLRSLTKTRRLDGRGVVGPGARVSSLQNGPTFNAWRWNHLLNPTIPSYPRRRHPHVMDMFILTSSTSFSPTALGRWPKHVPNPSPGRRGQRAIRGDTFDSRALHKRTRITDAKPTSFSDRYPFRIIEFSRPFQLSSNSQAPLSLPTEAGEGVLKTSYLLPCS
jgi:hypothetical protein